jgi:hypothetical protein
MTSSTMTAADRTTGAVADGRRKRENQPHEARRRAFIREHHPDRGGDPAAFIAGLRALDAERELGSRPLPKVVVVRRRPWPVRKATTVVRRLRYGPRPSRVRLPVTVNVAHGRGHGLIRGDRIGRRDGRVQRI